MQGLMMVRFLYALLVVAIGSNYALFFDRLDASGASAARTLASHEELESQPERAARRA